MSYQVAARRFRPQRFAAVKGQELTVQALRNSVRFNKIHHAILLAGLRGCGKTSLARIYAKALNCVNLDEGDPCGKCATCLEIAAGSSLSVQELDGASNNSVQDIRDLLEVLVSLPSSGYRYRVFIIDEVHMLSQAAFNALLKSLEEPPKQVVFILATTEPQKIPETVLSRCLRFDLASISVDNIAEQLNHISSGLINIEDRASYLIAELAEGSMRDAISMLERIMLMQNSGDVSEATVANYLDVVSSTRILGILGNLFSGNIKEGISNLSGVDPIKFVSALARIWRRLVFSDLAQGSLNEFFNLYLRPLTPQQLVVLSSLVTENVNLIYRNHYPRLALDAFLVTLGVHYQELRRGEGLERANQQNYQRLSSENFSPEMKGQSQPANLLSHVSRAKEEAGPKGGTSNNNSSPKTSDQGDLHDTPIKTTGGIEASSGVAEAPSVNRMQRGQGELQGVQDFAKSRQVKASGVDLDRLEIERAEKDGIRQSHFDPDALLAESRDPESIIAEFIKRFSRIDRQFLDNCQIKYEGGTIYVVPKNKFTKLHLESLDVIREGYFAKDQSIKVKIVAGALSGGDSKVKSPSVASATVAENTSLGQLEKSYSTLEKGSVDAKKKVTPQTTSRFENEQNAALAKGEGNARAYEIAEQNVSYPTHNDNVEIDDFKNQIADEYHHTSKNPSANPSINQRLAKDHPASMRYRGWRRMVDAFPESEFFDI